jgi:hypothetical protein
MAKAKYNPLNALREDPLAGLKQATIERESETEPLSTRAIEEIPAQAEAGLGVPVAPQDGVSGQRASLRTIPGRGVSSAPIKLLSANLKPSRNTVYLYPEDLTKLRQLSGYASTEHGMRANDSMIVRAALSLIDTDVRFLHALKEAELSDRRRTVRSS